MFSCAIESNVFTLYKCDSLSRTLVTLKNLFTLFVNISNCFDGFVPPIFAIFSISSFSLHGRHCFFPRGPLVMLHVRHRFSRGLTVYKENPTQFKSKISIKVYKCIHIFKYIRIYANIMRTPEKRN